MSEKIEDVLGFSHGDTITQAFVLRPNPGGRYIAAFFVIKRGASLFDFYISGAGALREKNSLSDQEVRVMVEDFKSSSSEMPAGAIWDAVEVKGFPMGDQLEALIAAGIPLRYEVSEP